MAVGAEAAERLDPAALMDRARADAGLDDFGDIPFAEALGVLCASAREQNLQGPALEAFAGNIQRLLATRLRLAADRKAYPEIPRQEIRRPLILTGIARSGTTILHSLLSQDPAARSPQKWEVDQPSPPPRRETYGADPRIAVAAAAVERLEPEFRAMHQMGAQLPEECNNIQTLAFQSPNFAASVELPSYADWLYDTADTRPAYALHRQFLQHLQAFAPGERWVLKAPPHLYWMDRLLETYPDACVVVTHRDPAEVLPSNASLIAFLRGRLAEVDPRAVGAEQVKIWGLGMRRTMAFRSTLARPEQIFDTHYADFTRDPLGVVRAIYDHFGFELTPAAETAMRAFMAENRQGKHGRHVYTAEQFGLDPATIHREFADYIDHYGIKVRQA